MNREEAIEGIAAYKHEQQVLLRLLRKHGKLTEKDFDCIFWESYR